jgi:hypothetical protein
LTIANISGIKIRKKLSNLRQLTYNQRVRRTYPLQLDDESNHEDVSKGGKQL